MHALPEDVRLYLPSLLIPLLLSLYSRHSSILTSFLTESPPSKPEYSHLLTPLSYPMYSTLPKLCSLIEDYECLYGASLEEEEKVSINKGKAHEMK